MLGKDKKSNNSKQIFTSIKRNVFFSFCSPFSLWLNDVESSQKSSVRKCFFYSLSYISFSGSLTNMEDNNLHLARFVFLLLGKEPMFWANVL